VLKSPFINKRSREQFKVQIHSVVIFFSIAAGSASLEHAVESLLIRYSSSQYLEVKLVKQHKTSTWRNW
jgi:ribosomal protein S10